MSLEALYPSKMKLTSIIRKIRFYVVQFILSNFSWFWKFLQMIPITEKYTSRFFFNFFGKAIKLPTQYSTIAPYTTLETFTEREYFGRILPPCNMKYPSMDLKKLTKILFQRKSCNHKYNHPKSNILFSGYAQFLIDQFIITNPDDTKKQLGKNTFDLRTLYGSNSDVTFALRTGSKGKLKSQFIKGFGEYPLFFQDNPYDLDEHTLKLIPPNVELNKLFSVGSMRLNVSPASLLFVIVFLREHNRICEILCKKYEWDDERLFQTAKNILTVEFLKITLEDYISSHITQYLHFKLKLDPEFLKEMEWNTDNRILVEFNHLYRWHNLIPDTIKIAGNTKKIEEVLWKPELFAQFKLEKLVEDFVASSASHFGLQNTPSFLLSVEENTLKMGRALKLASYNDIREAIGLWRVKSFEEITTHQETQELLRKVYGNVDNIEFYPGLMAEEPTLPTKLVPPLMAIIVASQAFSGILGHTLIMPHVYNEETFTKEGMEIISQTSLQKLFENNINPFIKTSFSPKK